MDEMEKIFTVPEVAEYLKMSKAKVYYLLNNREIPHLKLGRNVRIRKSDLDKYLEDRLMEDVNRVFSEVWKKHPFDLR